MKAKAVFNPDGSITIVGVGISVTFESLSSAVTFCKEHGVIAKFNRE